MAVMRIMGMVMVLVVWVVPRGHVTPRHLRLATTRRDHRQARHPNTGT